jgi:hypothetical protein
MNTLVCGAGKPPDEKFWRCGSVLSCTPGASCAKLRKLRLFCGRLAICSRLTLTATSEVLFSKRWAETSMRSVPAIVPDATSRLTWRSWPIPTSTNSVASWASADTAIRYWPGARLGSV